MLPSILGICSKNLHIKYPYAKITIFCLNNKKSCNLEKPKHAVTADFSNALPRHFSDNHPLELVFQTWSVNGIIIFSYYPGAMESHS